MRIVANIEDVVGVDGRPALSGMPVIEATLNRFPLVGYLFLQWPLLSNRLTVVSICQNQDGTLVNWLLIRPIDAHFVTARPP